MGKKKKPSSPSQSLLGPNGLKIGPNGLTIGSTPSEPVTQEAKEPVIAPVETQEPVQAQASVATPQATPIASSGLANNEANSPLSKTVSSKKKVARGRSRNRTILSSPYGADEAKTKKKTLLGQ
jgi:hypothetical protein